MAKENVIYTIGHSTHEINFFIDILKKFNINCIVDVRSVPNSAYSPQFNRKFLEHFLVSNHIQYLHFKDEFGARHTNPKLLDKDGKVDFDKVRETPEFLSGVERLRIGIEKGYNICLMCSEGEPFDCHRFSLISYHLVRNGFDVEHILKDMTTINNSLLENQLLEKYKKRIPSPTLFDSVSMTDDEKLHFTYKLRNKDIAYSESEDFKK